MSAPDKVDPRQAWRFAQKLLADEELERLDRMTDEEVEADLRAQGRGAVPSAESLLAGAALHAERNATAKAVAEAVAGVAEARVAKVVPIARADGSRRASRVSRVPRLPWLVAAGFVLLLGGLAATEGRAIVAWFRQAPEPILPDNEKGPPPTPHELADKLRDEADTACQGKLWGLCGDKLDEAQKLDPAGDSEPRVARMRAAIVDNTTFRPERKDRPK